MEEREQKRQLNRREAWRRRFSEKIGRDHFSSIQGFVVAGPIFDILDDIDYRDWQKRMKQTEDQMKQRYNVVVYRLLRYPPQLTDRKRFVE